MSEGSEVAIVGRKRKMREKAQEYADEFAKEYGMEEVPEVYVVENEEYPTFGKVDNKPAVFIPDWFEKGYWKDEPDTLRSTVRHECGHLLAGHFEDDLPYSKGPKSKEWGVRELQATQYDYRQLTWKELGELMVASIFNENMTYKESTRHWTKVAREFGMSEQEIKKAKDRVRQALEEEKEFTNWG